ncbi:MAG: right-handed parallel beta-helix repeat-containing protein, partial [Pseudomonadota bacterium]
LGANSYGITAAQGVVTEFDAGSDNTIAGLVTSDVPIVVAHLGYNGPAPQDAYPVPPAAMDLWGVRSQTVVVGALSDNTSISVYASDSATGSYSLDSGDYVSVTTGASTANGQGAALRLVADGPVAAVQVDDSDGTDASGFWQAGFLAVRHGLPVDTQYAAVACPDASTSVTLYQPGESPVVATCNGSTAAPGKHYFGAATSGANIAAGSYLESDKPIYVMYESSVAEDERNVLGYRQPANPQSPSLNAVTSPTNDNPVAVSGSGPANTLIRLYVNGELQDTSTSAGDGSFSFNAALLDGDNAISATAWDGSAESAPSTPIALEYVNNLSREQGGTITGSVVWTPGSTSQPYTITTGDLVVDAGAELILQPGTEVRFGSGRGLTVNGTLKIVGSEALNVVLTSNLPSPARGSWRGVIVGGSATGVVIEHALIEWTVIGVDLTGVSATLRYNTIRNFSSRGVYVTDAGGSASLLTGNMIDNLNDTGDCVYIVSSSPTLEGNVLTNCQGGLSIHGASAPAVTNDNEITSNGWGLYVYGNGFDAPLVVTGNRIYDNVNYNYWVGGFSATA